MTDHIVVIGYGDTGRGAVNSVLASHPDAGIAVLDIDAFAVAEAAANGAIALHADGRDLCALRSAAVEVATRVIVAVPDDLDALLIAKAVLSADPCAVVVVVIREPENHALFLLSGVTSVHIGHDGTEK